RNDALDFLVRTDELQIHPSGVRVHVGAANGVRHIELARDFAHHRFGNSLVRKSEMKAIFHWKSGGGIRDWSTPVAEFNTRFLAARDGGDNRDFVAVFERRVEFL